ncbi:MAG: 5-formyltetrahydrofolate cyclo-ligase [Magnetococcales bacterium]|nr:5-formyltetrahydrofolate cyclo-ligase [Magnetococcales bacterium]
MEAEKKNIRDDLRRVRRLLAQEEVHRLSTAVCQQAQMLPHFQRASSIGLYLSIDNEVDPSSLLLAANSSEKTVFLPIVDREQRSLRFVRYRENDPLVTGAFGIREPVWPPGDLAASAHLLPRISSLDILFLPLVAFDACGWRLGYGGGYYDRLLSRAGRAGGQRPLLVGLAYHFQEVAALPHAAHDIPMDWVVTDRACLVCSGADARDHTHR